MEHDHAVDECAAEEEARADRRAAANERNTRPGTVITPDPVEVAPSGGWVTLDLRPVAGKWRLTKHAMTRLADMDGVGIPDVLRCVEEPEVVYSDSRYGKGNQWVAKRGRISVAHIPDERVIITVLWNTTEAYLRPGETEYVEPVVKNPRRSLPAGK